MEEHSGTYNNYLDFSNTKYGNSEYRNNLENTKFQFINFNKSSFQNCNLTNVVFKNCDFTRCDFTEVRQWNCVYENCKFTNVKFYNSTMGVEVKYFNCQFAKSKLYGKYFSFGQNTEFNMCTFESCEIKSTWILSIVFKECIFSSKLTDIRFSGEKEAKISTTNGRLEFPVTFVNCDFSPSIFEELEIMDGVILTETILPQQKSERFNNDRIYYPKEKTVANKDLA